MINKNQECEIISDLLPLYLEGKISEESMGFIREHLENCEGCRKNLEYMEISYDEVFGDFTERKRIKNTKKVSKRTLFGKAKGRMFVCGYLFFLFCIWVYIFLCFS